MSNRTQALRLYKELLKESENFKSYYYKNYFIRKTAALFKKQEGADEETLIQLNKKSEDLLAVIKRQTMITNLYNASKLVVENQGEQPEPEAKTNT